MKKQAGALLGGAAVVLVIWLYATGNRGAADPVEAGGIPVSSTALPDRGDGDVSALNAGDAEHRAAGVRRISHPYPDVPTSRSGFGFDDDPFIAESIAEQAWLDRNGYPNSEQWRTYSTAADAELVQAGSAGDSVAKVMFDARRFLAGDAEARNDLLHAGMEGSLFALELLSSSLAGSPQWRDPVGAYAVSRVVELKGNNRTAMGREVMFQQPLSQMQRIEGESRAYELLKEINDAQARTGRKGAGIVDPRPTGGG